MTALAGNVTWQCIAINCRMVGAIIRLPLYPWLFIILIYGLVEVVTQQWLMLLVPSVTRMILLAMQDLSC